MCDEGIHGTPPFPLPLRQGMLRGMPYQACSAWGGSFLANVRPDSPSSSDTFSLLRVAARLRRGGKAGSNVVR